MKKQVKFYIVFKEDFESFLILRLHRKLKNTNAGKIAKFCKN